MYKRSCEGWLMGQHFLFALNPASGLQLNKMENLFLWFEMENEKGRARSNMVSRIRLGNKKGSIAAPY
jgi:hypothetical protein